MEIFALLILTGIQEQLSDVLWFEQNIITE